MSSNVDAVIAALRVALNEAEMSNQTWWKVRAANRWINQLPGAWRGRWWHLRLWAEIGDGMISRARFIGHVCPVVPAPRQQSQVPRITVRHHAKAIVLDLVEPT
jgi:hypothetical protein